MSPFVLLAIGLALLVVAFAGLLTSEKWTAPPEPEDNGKPSLDAMGREFDAIYREEK